MTEVEAPLIGTGRLRRGQMAGETVVVTGAGGGCGFETARALVWLGANVVIAEIDQVKGQSAAARIKAESAAWAGAGAVEAVAADVGDEGAVAALKAKAEALFGKVDMVLNNATAAPLGAVKDAPIDEWDWSYRVNLRGPVLLARAFLPGMLARDHGVLASVPSSGAAPFMGPYEVLKTAQVELANTLAAELENTGVIAFSVGPGVAPTDTMKAALERLAPLYKMSVEEFAALSAPQLLPVEAAGAGMAAAMAMADRYRGLELASMQSLIDAGIEVESPGTAAKPGETKPGPAAPAATQPAASQVAPVRPRPEDAVTLCRIVLTTLDEQVAGWAKRSLFERQWVIRDFKKVAGLPAEQWLDLLRGMTSRLEAGGRPDPNDVARLPRLAAYWSHLAELAAGYEKNPAKREESVRIVRQWQAEVERLIASLG